ncbi:DUF4189 domain-containing protein [Nocardia sp. ET3-3]|uniref:DUF4189 domain-containing protein n=1 Tax=Nocardia terrae TaxID=2675851 RepID=A0A7K1UYI7_9NOCA|nr:DUF4189 domain-containing protein [Nocardia terrae]
MLKFALIKAAVVAVASAGLVTSFAAAANAERGPDGSLYGALATGPTGSRNVWGSAVNYPTQELADRAAVAECGADCIVGIEFSNGCGSMAENPASGWRAWGNGANVADSEQNALNALAARSSQSFLPSGSSGGAPGQGRIVVTKCTG